MYDYLNEFLFWTSRLKRRNEYARAVMWKKTAGRIIFNSLCHSWVSRFTWKSPEKTINTDIIERSILFGSCVAFAKMYPMDGDILGNERVWLSGLVSAQNNLSHYGMPTGITITDYVGRIKGTYMPVLDELPDDMLANCAIIRDNFIGMVPILSVMYHTERLLDIDTSIRACVKNIRGTTIIACSEEQSKTVKASIEAAEVGVPYVLTYNRLDPEMIPAQLMSTPGAAEELKTLYEAADKVKADFLQEIGVRVNNEMDRRSGITPIEIVENRQNIDESINAFKAAREKGIRQCREIGLELSVSTSNLESTVSSYDSQGNKIDPNGGESSDNPNDPAPNPANSEGSEGED